MFSNPVDVCWNTLASCASKVQNLSSGINNDRRSNSQKKIKKKKKGEKFDETF